MVYFISDGFGIKVGYTNRQLQDRLKELRTSNPRPLEVIATLPEGTLATEADIHRNWHNDRINLEWFNDSEAMRKKILDLCADF